MNVLQKDLTEQPKMGAQILSPKEPEDMILGVVVDRLLEKHEITFSEFSKATGVPRASLCDLTAGNAQRHMGRIMKISRFFRFTMGLDFATSDYLLTGEEGDLEELKKRIVQLEKENKDLENRLSFFHFIEEKKEAV